MFVFFFRLFPVSHDDYICANIERGGRGERGDSTNSKGVEMANVNTYLTETEVKSS